MYTTSRSYAKTLATLVLSVSLSACGGQVTDEVAETPPGYRIWLEAGNNQRAPGGTALADSVIVRGFQMNTERDGLIWTVEWTVLSGGGSVAERETGLDAASVPPTSANVWTLGPESGSQALEARVKGFEYEEARVVFTARATDGP